MHALALTNSTLLSLGVALLPTDNIIPPSLFLQNRQPLLLTLSSYL